MRTARQWMAWGQRKRIAHSLKLLEALRTSPPSYRVLPVKGGLYGILKRDAFSKQGTWLPQQFADSERANEFLVNFIRQQNLGEGSKTLNRAGEGQGSTIVLTGGSTPPTEAASDQPFRPRWYL